MKKFFSREIAIATVAMAIFAIITACSSKDNAFVIDAHFLNMNMADFYVYSPDGAIDGIDTIHVNGGRFTYSHDIADEGTIVIVFPNYTTMPVFVEPGADISIEANAAHLKAMKITGNDANEVYTNWRENCSELSPKELAKHAERFINDHPDSPVSRWLVDRYFITAPSPDYKKAEAMLKKMLAATESNLRVSKMLNGLSHVGMLNIGDPLPRFTAKDIDGKPVTNGSFLKGNTIVLAWSCFSYESQNMLRIIALRQKNDITGEAKADNVLTLCLEPDVKQCRKILKQCGAEDLTTICDTTLFDSQLMKTFGFTNIPDNVRFQNGKVKVRRAPVQELFK